MGGHPRSSRAFLIVAVTVWFLLGRLVAQATSPHLAATTPAGAQAGSEVEVTFRGERLADAQEILWYAPGIQVLSLEIPTNQAAVVKARLQIAPDCRLGEHALRVRCASGISDLRTFWVGAFPSVADAVTNTDFAHPQPIPLNVTVQGVVPNEVVHHYRIEARQGQRISAEVEGLRLGRTQFDPFVAVLNARRFVLASSDDTALLLQDPACSVVAPEHGTYVIQIRESSYGGNDQAHFRLHVGTFPRPTGVFPPGGKAGETLTVRFLGDAVGDLTQEVKLPDEPRDLWPVFAQADGQRAPSPNWLRVSPFPNVLEAEPNDDKDHATPTGTNTAVACNGIIAKSGDEDWYRFRADKGQVLDIQVYARRLRSPLDPVLSVHEVSGNTLASNDDDGGPDSRLRFTAPAAGEFLLRVSDHLRQGGADFCYRVELAPVTPTLALKVPDVARNNAQERKSIVVPRGNRFATLVQAERRDFGGDLVFQAPDLPAGITFQADRLPANQNVLPIVFEAAADAPIAGRLCDLTSQPADPALRVAGKIRQDFVFVRGEPGDSVFAQTVVDRIAVAVVEEAPFQIQVLEPKVPLVRSGTLDLKIQAQRAPGFDEPIAVRMIYNPPGVGSANEVVIPKGASNALYRVNANGDAELRAWKIAFLASANVGGAPVWVSSQLASLTLAEPFVTMKLEMASAEPGQTARVVGLLEHKTPFEGKATCQLLGLPNAATTAETTFTQEDKQVVFDVATTTATPVGQHRSLFCAVTILQNGEPIQHSVGGGGCLRIDPPKPAPKAEAGAPPAPTAAAPPPPPGEKPLTRLEKLRRDHLEKRRKALEGAAK